MFDICSWFFGAANHILSWFQPLTWLSDRAEMDPSLVILFFLSALFSVCLYPKSATVLGVLTLTAIPLVFGFGMGIMQEWFVHEKLKPGEPSRSSSGAAIASVR